MGSSTKRKQPYSMGNCRSVEEPQPTLSRSRSQLLRDAHAERPLEECPVCFNGTRDVEHLEHAGELTSRGSRPSALGDTSSHRACEACRKQMVERNMPCPWCRSEMVWQNLFGFVDSLKGNITNASGHNELAGLMDTWQEYELTRSRSDVIAFARDMAQDLALCTRIDQAVLGSPGWLRDSAGLRCRLHAMTMDGELVLAHPSDSQRLSTAVECARRIMAGIHTSLARFMRKTSSSSTTTLAQLCR